MGMQSACQGVPEEGVDFNKRQGVAKPTRETLELFDWAYLSITAYKLTENSNPVLYLLGYIYAVY